MDVSQLSQEKQSFEYLEYDKKPHLMVRLQTWNSGNVELLHYQVHSESEW